MVTREKATEIDIWGVGEKVEKCQKNTLFLFLSCYFDIYLNWEENREIFVSIHLGKVLTMYIV